MLPVLVLGVLVFIGGVVLFRDIGGAAQAVIRGVTSRNLGTLAPGYAASPGGLRVYALLVVGIGIALMGLGILPIRPFFGLVALAAGVIVFLVTSVLIIRGEVSTYRALPKR